MQMKYDSASLGRMTLPARRVFTPVKPAVPRAARSANSLLMDRAAVLRARNWETAAWLLLSASTLAAIGLCFLA